MLSLAKLVKRFLGKLRNTKRQLLFCESKINSLKDRISKALADDRISDEEFENIPAEMEKYHEMKKDIRVGLKKNKVKKNGECSRITPRDSCGHTQKLAFEEDRRK